MNSALQWFKEIGQGGRPLSPPVRVELTAREAEWLVPYLGALADIGMEVEPFGGHTFLVRSLPAPLAEKGPPLLSQTWERRGGLGGEVRARERR